MEKIYKSATVESNDEHSFKGILSTYGNVDVVGDVLKKGAFTKSLEKRKTYPLLFNHNDSIDNVIGYMELEETEKGLEFDAKLIEGDKNAEKVYTLLKAGALSEMSIGFLSGDFTKNKHGGYDFEEITIKEGSVVYNPANEKAQIQSVKNNVSRETDEEKLKIKKQELMASLESLKGRL